MAAIRQTPSQQANNSPAKFGQWMAESETRGTPTPVPYIRVKLAVSHADNHLFHLTMSLKDFYRARCVQGTWSTSSRGQWEIDLCWLFEI